MKDENVVQMTFEYIIQGYFRRTEDLRNRVVEGLSKIPDVKVRGVSPIVPLGQNLNLEVSHDGKVLQVLFPCIDGTVSRPECLKRDIPNVIEVDGELFEDISRLAEKAIYVKFIHACLQDMNMQEIKSEFPSLAEAVDRSGASNRSAAENEKARLAALYRSVEEFLASHPRP